MSDDKSPDQVPGPQRLKFTQAFGFGVESEAITAALNQTIDTAQQVRGALVSKISESNLHSLVDTAVYADSLKARIAGALGTQVEQSQAELQRLQHPIFSNVVNELGGTLEATAHLGVTVPPEGGEATCPDCVVIRSSAQSGDLGPALECYRATALPLRDARGLEYASRLEWIRRCLPEADQVRAAFDAAVAAVNSTPNFPGYPEITAGPALYTPQPSPAAPAGPDRIGVIGAAGGRINELATVNGILAAHPEWSAPECAAAVAAWAAELHTALVECGRLYGSDPITYARCVADAQAAAIANPPDCRIGAAGPLPPGGAAVSPPGGVAGGVGSRFPPAPGPAPSPPRPPLPLPIVLPDWVPGAGQVGVPGTPQIPVGQVPPVGGTRPSVPTGGVTIADIQLAFTRCAQSGLNFLDCVEYVRSQLGVPIYPAATERECEAGYVWFVVNATGGDTNKGVCAKLSVTSQQPAPAPYCCPSPPITINVPPCPSPFQAPAPTQPEPTPRRPETQVARPLNVVGAAVDGCAEFSGAAAIELPFGFAQLSRLLGLRREDGTLNVPRFDDDSLGVKTGVTTAVVAFLAALADNSGGLLQSIFSQAGCLVGKNLELTAAGTILGFLRQWTGAPLEQLIVPNEQQRNYNCPTKLPSESQAASAWLGNTIDAGTLECWVRAAGHRFPEFSRVIDAARTKLQSLQIGSLYLRGELTKEQYNARIRELGFTRQTDSQDVLNLLRQIPPPSDLVRFMVRDAGDNDIVNRFGLDDEFDKKFAGRIPEWSKAQGVDLDYMRYVWRSHWSIPAPGQLANMLHRLSRLPPGDPRHVDLPTVRAALVQQDIAPFWIDKFVATSFAPLTRIDSRRAFEIGALDAAALKESYLNLGYDDSNADVLVEFNKRNLRRGFLRRPEIKQLATGELDYADYDAEMTRLGADSDTKQAGIERAVILRRNERRKRCIKAYHQRYLRGEFDSQKAISLIQSQGQNLEGATEIVGGWTCELDARGKEFSAGLLNQMYEAGLIDEADYVRRAIRIGYDNDDAVRLLRLQQRRLGIKATKMQAAEIAAEQKAQEKLAREILKQSNRDRSDREKAARATAKARTAKDMRTKRLLAAGEKFASNSQLPLPEAILEVRSIYNETLRTYAVTSDEVIVALTTVLADERITTIPLLVEALATALTVSAQ